MELLLFRHGPAEDLGARWPEDRLRPLSKEGREKTAEAAAGLVAAELRPDRIVASPLVRAQETAKILAAAFRPEVAIETDDVLSPGRDASHLVRALVKSKAHRVALVGHEPSMSALLSRLLTGEPDRISSDFKKAAVAILEVGGGVSTATLVAFLPPRLLRRLAR